MKCIIAVAAALAFAAAEVPSNTYLPPPSRGYPQGGPEVIAARSLDLDSHEHGQGHVHGITAGMNGFTRSGVQNLGSLGLRQQGPQARFNQEELGSGYDQDFARNAVDGNTASANYGYKAKQQFGHQEHRLDEEARVLPDRRKQTYEADERGFKPRTSYEDSEDVARSGYDRNSNNYGNTGYHGNEHGARSNGRAGYN